VAAPTRHEGSRKRNGHELHREAEESLPLYGFATNVGDRLSHVVRERPLLALAGGVAFGFVVGASVARRDGRLFVSAARLVLGWAAANLFEA
jgi:hypothetical protein